MSAFDNYLYYSKRLLPRRLLESIRPLYHFSLAFIASVYYRHPSRELTVIAVTGTKGKSTVTEIMAHILRTHGHTVASLSTIQFAIGNKEERNLFKMTTPGRFFVQRFLRKAVEAGCTHAVIEMTSEAAKQHRHRFIEYDALIFTNLTPEHIESHGSFANYKACKLRIAEAVVKSTKRPRYLVANVDNEHGQDFLDFPVEHKLPYSLNDLDLYTLHKDGVSLIIDGVTVRVPLVGLFNVYNALAAITLGKVLGVSLKTIEAACRSLPTVKGRVEHFESGPHQKKVTAVVDYAHTPDSLEQFYQAFPEVPKICILGNTGGGRDTWKRPEMGAIAARYCDQVILTNEDPYDENPRYIVEQMAKGIENKSKLGIIMDRRDAIKTALNDAPEGGYVLITGKGTDPYIMGPNNTRQPWSDAAVVTEELAKLPTRSDAN
jgi:UDP-N-acetylmuramoyl-L-alanyl-D-glutamate--2,6-diaminopimelate ligase